jgi:hypothetical protein
MGEGAGHDVVITIANFMEESRQAWHKGTTRRNDVRCRSCELLKRSEKWEWGLKVGNGKRGKRTKAARTV